MILSKGRIEELVAMQNKLNIATVGDDRATQGLNFRLAGIMEAAEAIDGLGYKWWKKQVPDFANAKVETVDIIHFMLSDSIMAYAPEDVIDIIYEGMVTASELEYEQEDKDSLVNVFQEMISLMSYCDDESIDSVDEMIYNYLFTAWAILGETPDSLYKGYMVKNILNGFRQENGYKEGTYKKMWKFDGEVVEDNVAAYKLAESLTLSDSFLPLLTEGITAAYKEA